MIWTSDVTLSTCKNTTGIDNGAADSPCTDSPRSRTAADFCGNGGFWFHSWEWSLGSCGRPFGFPSEPPNVDALTFFPWLGRAATSPFGYELAICTHICSPSRRKALTSEGQDPRGRRHFHVGCYSLLAEKGLETVSLWERVPPDIISPCESHLLWFPGSGAVHLSKGYDRTPHLAKATYGWGIRITRSSALRIFRSQIHYLNWPRDARTIFDWC